MDPMKGVANFFRSLGGPAFWLLVFIMSMIAGVLLLLAFSVIKLPKSKWF
jgi:hypothetical protein